MAASRSSRTRISRGHSVSFRDDTPDLRGYSLNDKISSLEIPNGESWEVCQDINYGNRCQVLHRQRVDLRSMGWNDQHLVVAPSEQRSRIAAARQQRPVGNGNRQRKAWWLYDRANFRGNSTVVTATRTRARQPASAARRVRGGAWELCDRTGRCATVSQNVPDLSRLGLTGRITSARP